MRKNGKLVWVAIAGAVTSILITLIIWPAKPIVDEPAEAPIVEVVSKRPRKEPPRIPVTRIDETKPIAKAPAPPKPKEPDLEESQVVDPDDEFMERIASLPLDRAEHSTRLEVERRIKNSEKSRAKLIYSKSEKGKTIIAYAVVQASADEIRKMTSPYQLLLESQESPAGRAYVDECMGNLLTRFRLTDGHYRLLYAIIPEAAGGDVYQYSIAASSEAECLEILHDDLAPRPPIVMGVPYTDSNFERVGGCGRSIIPGQWRLDHLVAEEVLAPHYWHP